MNDSNQPNNQCCRDNSLLAGITYGLIPHIGCIAFIAFTVLGVTAATSLFKPLLMNAYAFYALIALSLIFATISAVLYLKRNGQVSIPGIRSKWKYLSVLYGTTIGVNLILFLAVFPLAANLTSASAEDIGSQMTVEVAIPCPGHAPLIIDELGEMDGVISVQFRLPKLFDIRYDPAKTSKEQMLSAEIFKTFKAVER